MSEKTATQLIEEIQVRLNELRELVNPDPKQDQPGGVIFERSTGIYYGVGREAKRVGVCLTYLSDYLHGRRNSPRLDKLVHIKEVK